LRNKESDTHRKIEESERIKRKPRIITKIYYEIKNKRDRTRRRNYIKRQKRRIKTTQEIKIAVF
jgi:hypothetical protein